ncbi:M23 family metallopeptidase [Candidatus Roizmanbacteria bacterium]|nr:MAG: M23 family metallopeptidase [Candidatus Roizmanbacteria bacterium]
MKALNYAQKLNQLKNDPIGFVIDLLITVVVNIFAPFPLPSVVVSQIKVPILGFLASLIILAFFFIMLVGTVLMSPMLLSNGFMESIKSLFVENTLNIPPDTSFISTAVPKQNPLGGGDIGYSEVTAYFLDPNYYLQFGKNHIGIDLIPSEKYFKNSQTFKETGKVAVFATINGTVNYYVDQYGGETVEITNDDQSIKVVFIHFSTVLVESGKVTAGTPIGIMGGTGFATGDHVHYEVHTKDSDTWKAVNPLNYIQ